MLKSARRSGVSIVNLSKDIVSDAGPIRFAKARARGRSRDQTEDLFCLIEIVRKQSVGSCRGLGLHRRLQIIVARCPKVWMIK